MPEGSAYPTPNYTGLQMYTGTNFSDTITVPDSGAINRVSVSLNIIAPDEGAGEDPMLLKVSLRKVTGSITSVLSDGFNELMHNINYDEDRQTNPVLDVLRNNYVGLNSADDWELSVETYSSATYYVDEWTLYIVFLPASPPVNPAAPAAPAISGAAFRNTTVNIRRNLRHTFKFNQSFEKVVKYVPFNARVENFIVSEPNSNVGFTLHKVSSGVDTVIYTQAAGATLNTYTRKLIKIAEENKAVNAGDYIYLVLDSISGDPTDFIGQVTLVER